MHRQCIAKGPFTSIFGRLAAQRCRALDRLSERVVMRWAQLGKLGAQAEVVLRELELVFGRTLRQVRGARLNHNIPPLEMRSLQMQPLVLLAH